MPSDSMYPHRATSSLFMTCTPVAISVGEAGECDRGAARGKGRRSSGRGGGFDSRSSSEGEMGGGPNQQVFTDGENGSGGRSRGAWSQLVAKAAKEVVGEVGLIGVCQTRDKRGNKI